MLWHRGEHMTVKFHPAAEGGTHVTIGGAVAKSKQARRELCERGVATAM